VNRIDYFYKLLNHDWFYAMSDDHSKWVAGEAAEATLARLAVANEELQPMLTAFVGVRAKSLSEGKATEFPTFHELTGNHLAVLIDPTNRSIMYVEYDGNYQSIYKLIDAQCFDVVRIDKGDTIFVDDEGLINGKGMRAGFFVYGNYPQPLAGKGLVLGVDDEGDSVSCANSLAFFENNISWVDSIFNNNVMATPHTEVKAARQGE
jgi:hypothetical protein